jgi:hypothetical protein
VEDALAFINEKNPTQKKENEGYPSSFFLVANISIILLAIFIIIFIIGSRIEH